MFFRLGISEIAIIGLICVFAVILPAVLLAALSNVSKRMKNIEEKLKDKS